jgi:hypothetical protein
MAIIWLAMSLRLEPTGTPLRDAVHAALTPVRDFRA